MLPCRPDYIFIPSRGVLRFEPLGSTPLRDSRCTFRHFNYAFAHKHEVAGI